MFQAQLLMSAPNGSSAGTGAVFSPWFKRQGDWLRATSEVAATNLALGVTISVYTKNSDDVGDGSSISPVSGSLTQTSVGRATAEYGNATIKELVRYKFDPGVNGVTGAAWVLFRMLPPVWFDAVK